MRTREEWVLGSMASWSLWGLLILWVTRVSQLQREVQYGDRIIEMKIMVMTNSGNVLRTGWLKLSRQHYRAGRSRNLQSRGQSNKRTVCVGNESHQGSWQKQSQSHIMNRFLKWLRDKEEWLRATFRRGLVVVIWSDWVKFRAGNFSERKIMI